MAPAPQISDVPRIAMLSSPYQASQLSSADLQRRPAAALPLICRPWHLRPWQGPIRASHSFWSHTSGIKPCCWHAASRRWRSCCSAASRCRCAVIRSSVLRCWPLPGVSGHKLARLVELSSFTGRAARLPAHVFMGQCIAQLHDPSRQLFCWQG